MSTRLNFLACLVLLFTTNSFAENLQELSIVPKPQQEIVLGESVFLGVEWKVYADPKVKEPFTYITTVLQECGLKTVFTDKKSNADLILEINKKISKNPEAYQLSISQNKKIQVSAVSYSGLLYAIQSLRQMISHQDNGVVVPVCRIVDEPAFAWRAFMLDESRHFQGMETVKKLLDEMSYLKMNTFHWHLVDDPG